MTDPIVEATLRYLGVEASLELRRYGPQDEKLAKAEKDAWDLHSFKWAEYKEQFRNEGSEGDQEPLALFGYKPILATPYVEPTTDSGPKGTYTAGYSDGDGDSITYTGTFVVPTPPPGPAIHFVGDTYVGPTTTETLGPIENPIGHIVVGGKDNQVSVSTGNTTTSGETGPQNSGTADQTLTGDSGSVDSGLTASTEDVNSAGANAFAESSVGGGTQESPTVSSSFVNTGDGLVDPDASADTEGDSDSSSSEGGSNVLEVPITILPTPVKGIEEFGGGGKNAGVQGFAVGQAGSVSEENLGSGLSSDLQTVENSVETTVGAAPLADLVGDGDRIFGTFNGGLHDTTNNGPVTADHDSGGTISIPASQANVTNSVSGAVPSTGGGFDGFGPNGESDESDFPVEIGNLVLRNLTVGLQVTSNSRVTIDAEPAASGSSEGGNGELDPTGSQRQAGLGSGEDLGIGLSSNSQTDENTADTAVGANPLADLVADTDILVIPDATKTNSTGSDQSISNGLNIDAVLDLSSGTNDLSSVLENLGSNPTQAPADLGQSQPNAGDTGSASDATAESVTSLGALESGDLMGSLDPLDLGAGVEVFA